jgi:hypothetical protein
MRRQRHDKRSAVGQLRAWVLANALAALLAAAVPASASAADSCVPSNANCGGTAGARFVQALSWATASSGSAPVVTTSHPSIGGVRVDPAVFAVARGGSALLARSGRGTHFSFTLSGASGMTLTIQRGAPRTPPRGDVREPFFPAAADRPMHPLAHRRQADPDRRDRHRDIPHRVHRQDRRSGPTTGPLSGDHPRDRRRLRLDPAIHPVPNRQDLSTEREPITTAPDSSRAPTPGRYAHAIVNDRDARKGADTHVSRSTTATVSAAPTSSTLTLFAVSQGDPPANSVALTAPASPWLRGRCGLNAG